MKISKTVLRILLNQYNAVLLAGLLGTVFSIQARASVQITGTYDNTTEQENVSVSSPTLSATTKAAGGGSASESFTADLVTTDDLVTATVGTADTLTGLTATVEELNYVDGVTSNIQNQLDAKQETLNASTDITVGKITANGEITGASLSVAGGAISGGAISGSSLTVGSSSAISSVDDGATALTSGNETTLATTGTVLKSAENAAYSGTTITGGTASTLSEALSEVADQVNTNTTKNTTQDTGLSNLAGKLGVSYEASTGAVGVTDYTSNNVVSDGENVVEAIGKIDTKVGTITGTTNNITASDTLSKNLTDLDVAIGDRANLASSNATINAATTTSVVSGLQATGNAIGDMDLTGTRYILSASDLTSASRLLDTNLNRVEARVDSLDKKYDARMNSLDNKIDKMDDRMNSGFASLAAMSGLQPNARACNDTQLSLGAGTYRGKVGYALGAFHYFNDNVMMNVGASYAGNNSTTFRGGVTFGW